MPLQSFLTIPAANGPGRRHAARVRLALIGKVILASGHEPCFLDDLSQSGASLTIARNAPPIGDGAVMMVNGVEVLGAVIWRHGTHFGLHFDDPVATEDVVRLRAIHDQFAAIEAARLRRNARDFVQRRRGF